MIPSQSNSFLDVRTLLDEYTKRDRKFEVMEIEGSEGVCRDFHYSLLLVSYERLTEGDFTELLGSSLTVSILFLLKKGTTEKRLINGVVYNIKEIGLSKYPFNPEVWKYEISISSWFWQLRQVKDCRIFQKNTNTMLTIVKNLLTELELTDFKDETTRSFPKIDYCVMYNESIHNFILRRMNDVGIMWRFEFEENKHTLVLFDEDSKLPERSIETFGRLERFEKFSKESNHHVLKGFGTATFDYENSPVKTIKAPNNLSKGSLYRYQYPGAFKTRSDEEERVLRFKHDHKENEKRYIGKSTIRNLQSGIRSVFKAPTLPDLHDKKFLITELHLKANREDYSNSFIASEGATIPTKYDSKDFYQPEIKGSQTAFVVGGDNPAKTQTDKTSRVKVRFHWDHHSPSNDEHTSAFIRNSTTSSGPRRGYLFVPKIGDELVVSYIDSNPDKPIITGRVYSSNFKLPVKTDKDPWKSAIRADGGKGANHIVFDDKKDQENLEWVAKKDMNVTVGNDLEINVEEDLILTADSMEMIAEGNIIDGNIIATIGGHTTTIAGKSISNTTGLLITGFSGGLQNNLAGGAYANAAIGMVSNTSGGDMSFEGASIFNSTIGDVENEGKSGVQSKSLLVANTASDRVENSSGGDIEQKATLAIFTKSENVNNKFSDGVKTQSLMIKNKGNTVINE